MKKFLSIALAAALVTAAPLSYASSPQEALSAFHAALTAGDKSTASDLLAPDVAIFESGYIERSRAEYASHHLAGDIDFAKTATRRVLKQTERVQSTMAVIWQETETTGMSKGKPVHVFGTETALLEKKGDSWTITHVHWSSRKAK